MAICTALCALFSLRCKPSTTEHTKPGMRLCGFLLLSTLVLLLPIVRGTDIHVLGFKGKEDDASLRFWRSAEVFGYSYDEIDLSQFSDTPAKVADEIKLFKLKQYLDNVQVEDADNILILDSHSSLLLTRPTDLLHAAETLNSSFIFIGGSQQFETDEPTASQLFTGVLVKTGPLKAAFPVVPEELTANFVEAFLVNIVQDSKTFVDVNSKFFQHIGKDIADIKIRFESDRGYLQNVNKDTIPVIAVAVPDGKAKLNSISNYLVRAWSPGTGCQICDEERLDLTSRKTHEYPVVQVSVFISQPTPFLEPFFERLVNLSYPKDRLHLTIHCAAPAQLKIADAFLEKHGSEYRSTLQIDATKFNTQATSFKMAASQCLSKKDCEKFLYLDATVQFTLTSSLEHLVSANRSIVAPLITRQNSFWSTFWGDMNVDHSYLRSEDYFEIIERQKLGLWNVPLVGSVFLMSHWALKEVSDNLVNDDFFYYAIAATALEKNVFMFVDNRVKFGRLTNPTTFSMKYVNNDLWQIFDNAVDWEERYIHKDYFQLANESTTLADFEQPCPDIFHMPLMTELFCSQLVEEMENYGNWSDGTNYDSRLEGGYENVPTRDIHMRQIEWEDHWLHILRTYVYPIQLKLFEGYSDKPSARMNFVVRYKQGEQPSLRNHHDASTYTLDMALNRPNIDYEGGGVRFARYNCTLLDTRPGWPLIFPGRLTHIHEGLETTKGIRYIFVTFVNP